MQDGDSILLDGQAHVHVGHMLDLADLHLLARVPPCSASQITLNEELDLVTGI